MLSCPALFSHHRCSSFKKKELISLAVGNKIAVKAKMKPQAKVPVKKFAPESNLSKMSRFFIQCIYMLAFMIIILSLFDQSEASFSSMLKNEDNIRYAEKILIPPDEEEKNRQLMEIVNWIKAQKEWQEWHKVLNKMPPGWGGR